MTEVPVTWIFLRELAALVEGGWGDVACEGPHYQTYFPHMEIELFCTCQMPKTYDDMVDCDPPPKLKILDRTLDVLTKLFLKMPG